jgi:hypothetical protein
VGHLPDPDPGQAELAQVPSRAAVDGVTMTDPDGAGVAGQPLQCGSSCGPLGGAGRGSPNGVLQGGAAFGVLRRWECDTLLPKPGLRPVTWQ